MYSLLVPTSDGDDLRCSLFRLFPPLFFLFLRFCRTAWVQEVGLSGFKYAKDGSIRCTGARSRLVNQRMSEPSVRPSVIVAESALCWATLRASSVRRSNPATADLARTALASAAEACPCFIPYSTAWCIAWSLVRSNDGAYSRARLESWEMSLTPFGPDLRQLQCDEYRLDGHELFGSQISTIWETGFYFGQGLNQEIPGILFKLKAIKNGADGRDQNVKI